MPRSAAGGRASETTAEPNPLDAASEERRPKTLPRTPLISPPDPGKRLRAQQVALSLATSRCLRCGNAPSCSAVPARGSKIILKRLQPRNHAARDVPNSRGTKQGLCPAQGPLGDVRKSFRVGEVDAGLPKSGRAEGAECDSPALPPASSWQPARLPFASSENHVFRAKGWKLKSCFQTEWLETRSSCRETVPMAKTHPKWLSLLSSSACCDL